MPRITTSQVKFSIVLIMFIGLTVYIAETFFNSSSFQSKLDNRVGLTDMKDFIVTDPSGLHSGENLTYASKNTILEHLVLACAEDWCNGDWMVQFNNITCYKSKSLCFLEMSFINNENERNIKDKTCSISYPFVDSQSFFKFDVGWQPVLRTSFYDLVDQCVRLSVKSIEIQTMLDKKHK